MKFVDVPQTGSVGEVVSYENRYGQNRRQKVIPRDPRTEAQMEHRSLMQRARAFWGTLSDEEMLGWKLAASDQRTAAVLGQTGPLSGYELAVKINIHLGMLDLPMAPLPPAIPGFPVNPARALVATINDGAPSLKLQVSADPVQHVLVYAARPQGPGVSFVDHYVFLGLLPAPQDGYCDLTGLYLGKYSVVRIGQRIFIQTIQQINGWRDLPKTFSTRVQAA